MQLVQNEQRLQQAIGTALHQLRERAATQLPDVGDFAPLSTHFACAGLVQGVGETELRLGPVSTDERKKDRFVEVRVATPTSNSHSSSWVFYGTTAQLREALQNEPLMKGKIRASLLAAATSISRNEFA